MANLTTYPNIRPSLLLDFVNGGFDPRIAFSRPTAGNLFNSRGSLESAAPGVPRLDYDPLTGESLGLLVEPTRTNEIIQSEFATGLSGATYGGSVSVATMVGFSGAISVQPSAGTNYVYKSAPTVQGTSYYFAFVVEMDDGAAPVVGATSGVGDFNMIFAGGTASSPSVKNLGGGRYLVHTTQVAAGSTVFFGVAKYAGQGVRGFKVSAFDRQTGTFGTSYIATSASAVTRTMDAGVISGKAFSDFYNPRQGTLYIEMRNFSIQNATAAINDGTSGNRLIMGYDSAGATSVYNSWSNSGSHNIARSKRAQPAFNKLSASYAAGSLIVSANGEGYALGPGGGPLADRLQIGGSIPAAGVGAAHIRRIVYYPYALTGPQQAALTAP